MRAIGVTLLPPLLLLAFTALVFVDELTGGPLAYGRDTTAFYYPLTEWMAAEVRQGRLPFWLPLIFGGYPLLADGEIGPLYPPSLLLLAWLATPDAYAWMRALHYAVAALGLYALARVLRVGQFGAFIGGLSFAYGSFLVGHLQHDNILRSAAWLPWLLVAAELTLRASGPTRALWTLAGGLVLALQCLGFHVQPVLLSLLALAAYLVVGPLGGSQVASRESRVTPEAGSTRDSQLATRDSRVRAWLLSRLRIGAGIGAVGVGLAGAQLVPLLWLAQRSLRSSAGTYTYATTYSISPPQLLTAIFPYMFHFDAVRSWSLWSPHETTLYSGIAPLVLAIVGIGFVRTRAALFFAIVGVASLALCMGDYLPIKPYTVIWTLPGFSFLRAPARFSLLLQLAVACLAALGADWLGRRARGPAGRLLPRGLLALLTGLSLLSLGLAVLIQAARWWIQYDPSPGLELFRVLYTQTSKENWQLGPWHVHYGLLEFSRPDNLRTGLSLLLLLIVPLVLRAWLARPRLDKLWRAALGGLVVLDLWLFVGGFYPRQLPDQLRPHTPALDLLTAQSEPFRVFVEPDLNSTLGPNQLVPAGLATVNGYTSLEPRRFSDYWWSIVGQDNFLLDLFNARFVLAGRRIPGQRTYEGTLYHPSDRLMSGESGNPSGSEEFRVPPSSAPSTGRQVESLTVVAAVEGLGEVAVGTPVAELTLLGTDGQRHPLTLRAGVDVAEYLAPQPGYPTAAYVGPPVVWAGNSFVPNGTGRPVRLYGSKLAVSPPLGIVGLAVRTLAPQGRFLLHGLGLHSAEGSTYSLTPSDKAKYRLIYEDASLQLFENTASWPRVYVVGGAIQAEPGVPVLDQLLHRTWDPSREIMVEGVGPADVRQAQGSEPVGQAELLLYEPTRVVVRSDLVQPGYLVLADRYDEGWGARLDDRELPVIRANVIQRAVPVPAGSHIVTFVYDPWWMKVGFGLSGVAGVAVAGTALGAALFALQGRGTQ